TLDPLVMKTPRKPGPSSCRQRAAPTSSGVRTSRDAPPPVCMSRDTLRSTEADMTTREELSKRPREQHLERMARTADDLAAAILGRGEAALVRRPDAKNWSAKEIICHLRDTEELFIVRLETIAALDEPMIPAAGMGRWALNLKADGQPAAPDRWAEDRQYLRNDAAHALATFRNRPQATLAHLPA